MGSPSRKPERLHLKTHTTDFSFRGRRHRVSLNGPLTPKRAQALRAAVAAFALKEAQKRPQMLYFFQCDDRIKIGIAHDTTKRKRSLQTGSPGELKLLATIPADRRIERAVHAKFESTRIHGEWFSSSPELHAFVERVKRATRIVIDGDTGEVRTMVQILPSVRTEIDGRTS